MWKAFSPCERPSLMKGRKTRYSSSRVLKNAHTWRLRPSRVPAKVIGRSLSPVPMHASIASSSGEAYQGMEWCDAARQLSTMPTQAGTDPYQSRVGAGPHHRRVDAFRLGT